MTSRLMGQWRRGRWVSDVTEGGSVMSRKVSELRHSRWVSDVTATAELENPVFFLSPKYTNTLLQYLSTFFN